LISKTDGAPTFYAGERLTPGNILLGPSVVLFPDTTVYLGHPDSAEVDGYGNLLVEVGRK